MTAEIRTVCTCFSALYAAVAHFYPKYIMKLEDGLIIPKFSQVNVRREAAVQAKWNGMRHFSAIQHPTFLYARSENEQKC